MSSRSEDERERARLERERKRAAKEGRPLPEALAPAAVPEPPRKATPAPTPKPTPAPPVARPEPPRPAPTPPEPVAEAPLAWGDTDPGPDPGPEPVKVIGRREEPLGTKRVKASPAASAAGANPPPRYGPSSQQRGRPATRRGTRRVLPFVTLAIAIVVGWFLFSLFQPGHGDGEGRVAITIPAGASASDIGKVLADNDVVSSAFFFSLRSRMDDKRQNLRAGKYVMKKNMSYAAALEVLTTAPTAAKVITITIPEGRSISETVPLVKQSGLKGNGTYARAARDRRILDPRKYGAKRSVRTLEGFLFPATFELKLGSTGRTLVKQQVEAFKRNIASVDLRKAKRKNLTVFDVLTIASMVERESAVDKDRKLIAAVIYNRLKQRIPLGIDATTRYELKNWTDPLKQSDLTRDTPYNTRTRQGLPPTPIGNPGLKSIEAAANPANVPYLYFVVKPCGNGAHVFSSTDAEFQKDQAAYNAARDKRGGDPSRC